jgi:hypothetical protein
MKKMLLPILVFALLPGCGDQSSAPLAPGGARLEASTTTETVIRPINIVAFVPCANGGLGEHVSLTGSLHTVYHVTLDGAGGYHLVAITQTQGVSGVGLTTGDTYQGTEVTQNETDAQVGFEHTFTNSFLLIGQGPDNNYLFHWTLHFTENPDGTMTTFVDNFHFECR